MAGDDLPVPDVADGWTPQTVLPMSQANAIPAAPSEPAWDVTVTRLMRTLGPQVEAFALDLARRFQAIGLGIDTQVRSTPRGLSTFLALMGRRGLICIVDLTLVDGMAVGQGRYTALDIRLLDACGDVAADGLARGALGRACDESSAAGVLSPESLGRAATAVYVATLAQFDLLRPSAQRPRCA